MGTTDIIPDVHGQIAKLRAALDGLGWRRRAAGWHHSDPARRIVFLGDFIDRGPENRAVIHLVRDLIDSGKARAVMGNHELNALHFHTAHPETGRPLRPHSEKNLHQHASFLAEFPLAAAETREVLAWMRSLPLFLEDAGFRAVHACWIDGTIQRLRGLTQDGLLTEEQVIRAADPTDTLFQLAEEITKGPEQRLPDGFFFRDKDGTRRDHVRLQWWNAAAPTWREVAISVPDPGDLPTPRCPMRCVRRAIRPMRVRYSSVTTGSAVRRCCRRVTRCVSTIRLARMGRWSAMNWCRGRLYSRLIRSGFTRSQPCASAANSGRIAMFSSDEMI